MSTSIVPANNLSGNPQIFSFDDQVIRIVERNGEPWFIAVDVCRALGVSNATQAVERLDEDEHTLCTVEGIPIQTNIINESGLYSLILTSRKDEAKRFKKWITSDVLPTLRKTGAYSLQETNATPLTPLQAAKAIIIALEAQETRLARLEAKAEANQGAEFFTILAYAKLHKLRPPDQLQAAALGRRASILSMKEGVTISKVRDSRYGEVNSYHINILDRVFAESGGVV